MRFVSYSQGLVYLLRDKFYSLNSSIHFKKNIDSLIISFLRRKQIHFSVQLKFPVLLDACTMTNLSEDNKYRIHWLLLF